MEVCHIETPADKKKRLDKEKRGGKTRGKVKGKTSLKKADTESVADTDLDELEVEGVDGIQRCLPRKKRMSHTYGDEYRPKKKGRIE